MSLKWIWIVWGMRNEEWECGWVTSVLLVEKWEVDCFGLEACLLFVIVRFSVYGFCFDKIYALRGL